METPFWGRSLHSLSPSSPQGVFTHSRFEFLVSITEQKPWDSPLRFLKRSALLFSELFSLSFSPSLFSPVSSSPQKNHFKHQGCDHNTPLAPSYSQVT
ncbi:hypothetical protein TNCV_4019371 [Trichonephila clavipes]|nr:hypothetical protein TNCV_4019371 [Trichonephila clavipes]